jgi:CelD/BcsL family acetyltransferase involved in cellulose biosynthesis
MLAPAQTLLTTERRPLATLADITAPWRDLAARAAEPNVFYDPGFALAAAPVFGRDAETILVWSTEVPRRLLGLFPFALARRRYGVRLPVMVGWTHPFAPLGTPLVDREACADAIAAFIDHVGGDDALPDLLLLPFLHEAGPVAEALRGALARRGGTYAALDQHRRALLRPKTRREEYIDAAIPKKLRKELRRKSRRLAEIGPLSFHSTTSPADVAVTLQDFFTLEAGGWKGRAGTAVLQHPDTRRFIESAISALAQSERVEASRLCCGPQPIACALTLKSQNGAWGWKIAYDERFAGGSPGVQLYLQLTAKLLADPTIAFADSCAVPDHPMIDHIWRERLDIADWLIALKPHRAFARVCRLETLRRRAIGIARRWRGRLQGAR